MKGKNNSDRRNPSDIKRKEQQLTLKWFFLLSFARDASLSPVLSEITENTEESIMRNSNQIQMGRWKHYSKAIQAMVMRSTLEQYNPPLTHKLASFLDLSWLFRGNPKVLRIGQAEHLHFKRTASRIDRFNLCDQPLWSCLQPACPSLPWS